MLTSLGTIIQPTIERNMHNNYRDDMIVHGDQIANLLDHRKIKRVPEKHLFLFY